MNKMKNMLQGALRAVLTVLKLVPSASKRTLKGEPLGVFSFISGLAVWGRLYAFLQRLVSIVEPRWQWFVNHVLASLRQHVLPPAWRLFGLIVLSPLGWLARLTRLDRLGRFVGNWLANLYPWREMWLFTKSYYVGGQCVQAWTLAISMYTLMYLEAHALLAMASDFGHCMDVAQKLHRDEFRPAMIALVNSTAWWAVYNIALGYVRSWWGSNWRIWINTHFARALTVNEAHLRLQVEYPKIDNVGQRAAQTPDPVANNLVLLGFVFPQAPIYIYTFAPVLWGHEVWFPHDVLFACIGLSVFFQVVSYTIGNFLSKLAFDLNTNEANLRTHYDGWFANARAVAMQMNDRLVKSESIKKIKAIYEKARGIQRVNRNISVFTTPWGKLIEYGPQLFFAYLFMWGKTSSWRDVSLGATAFQRTYDGFSILGSQIGAIKSLQADLIRIGPLYDALEAIGANKMPSGKWIDYEFGDVLAFTEVTIHNTYLDRRAVVKALNLTIDKNAMFISKDGLGKARVADAITLFCAPGEGKILRPEPNSIIGVVKPAYMPNSSVRAFLTDLCEKEPADAAIMEALSAAGLANVPDVVDLPKRTIEDEQGNKIKVGLDTAVPLHTVLPEPDQLLLCLARIILTSSQNLEEDGKTTKLKLVVIDQAFGGINEAVVGFFFKALKLKELRFVTMSSDDSLAKYHDVVYEIGDEGDVTEHPAGTYKAGWTAQLLVKFGIAHE